MKIALGMIIRSLNTDEEITRFFDNADKYGHKLDCAIVAYSNRLDAQAAASINKRIPLHIIDTRHPEYSTEQFRRLGIPSKAAQALLECPVGDCSGLVPYGFNRTLVVTEAILRGVDILFFVDHDVFPSVLRQTAGAMAIEDEDFFGAHLEHLNSGSLITTGEYSGYSILPPASFDGMEELLCGLNKTEMIEFWQNCSANKCLIVQPAHRNPRACTKILGGNAGIALRAFASLPPFFSSSYVVDDDLYLCRGEDTLLGVGVEKNGVSCTDIELYPLHDTYNDFPAVPDLKYDKSVQERFYYACTGWIGRNPFISHLRGEDVQSAREYQREKLSLGISALAGYTSNPRYNSVMKNFEVSWGSLGRYIDEYEKVLEAWRLFIERSGLA